MRFVWNEHKNTSNRQKHLIGFEAIADFEWDISKTVDRSRQGDGEVRFASISWLNGKLYTVIYTWRQKDIRIISLRRANKSEEKIYGEST